MLACAGGAILGWSIDSFVRWKQPARSVQVLTLNQLVGFIVSASLLIIAGWMLVITLRRRHPALRRQPRRQWSRSRLN
jgi:hypothetical protein